MQQNKPAPQLLSRESMFLGGTGKMFLLCTALYLGTIFSIGIAYPWLSCALYRWETDNTVISGRRLHFDGKGTELFKKYIKWLGLTIITLGIYKLLLSRNVLMWKTEHTHFVADKRGTSYYKCKISEKLLMLVKYYAIIVCTLTIGKGIATCYKTCWTLEHTHIDGLKLEFNGKALNYLGLCILSVFLSVITAGIYLILVPVHLKRWETKHTAAELSPL